MDPRHQDALISAHFGAFKLTGEDVVFADPDGVIFTPKQKVDKLLAVADGIRQTERRQAEAIVSGKNLREQLKFNEYLAKRSTDPAYTFRSHLREIGGAIEE